MKSGRIEMIANIIVWIIAAVIVACGVFLGVAALLSLFGSGDFVVGVIICLGLILFSMFIAFVFISVFKSLSNMLFYSSIFREYKREKGREESDEKYNIY